MPVTLNAEARGKHLSAEARAKIVRGFLACNCYTVPGLLVRFTKLYEEFREHLDRPFLWTKADFAEALDALKVPRGRGPGNHAYCGNIDLKRNRPCYVVIDGKLRRQHSNYEAD